MGRSRPIWTSVVVCARVACALRLVQSLPVAIFLNHDRCAERCANDAFFYFVPSYLKHKSSSFLLSSLSTVSWIAQLNWFNCNKHTPLHFPFLQKMKKQFTFFRIASSDASLDAFADTSCNLSVNSNALSSASRRRVSGSISLPTIFASSTISISSQWRPFRVGLRKSVITLNWKWNAKERLKFT